MGSSETFTPSSPLLQLKLAFLPPPLCTHTQICRLENSLEGSTLKEMLFGRIWNGEKHVGFLRLARRYLSVSGRTVKDMAEKDGELRVFIVSGEISGDTIGSRLMASRRKLSSVPIHFSGVRGSANTIPRFL